MAIKEINYDNISSYCLGLVIQVTPEYDVSEKDYELTHIMGRNGDVLIDYNSYKNSERSYKVATIFTDLGNNIFPWKKWPDNNQTTSEYLNSDEMAFFGNLTNYNNFKSSKDFLDRIYYIRKWLNKKGYHILKDDYEVNYYRKANYYSSNGFQNVYNQGTGLDLVFNCKPQRYVMEYAELTGEYIIPCINRESSQNTYTVTNSNGYENTPLIEVNVDSIVYTGENDGKLRLTVSNTDVSIGTYYIIDLPLENGTTSYKYVLDYDIEDVYNIVDSSKVNYNNKITVTGNELLKFQNGTNNIVILLTNVTSANVSLTIYPNWWII